MEKPIKRKVIIEKSLEVPAISKEEFEKFLESIGGLVYGHRTDSPPIISAGFFSVGEGWFGILKKLIEESIKSGWNKEVTQSKEKFGMLHFYVTTAPTPVFEIISKYEKLSGETCEYCGNRGKQRSGGWIQTLCNDCYEQTNKKN